MTSTTGQRDLTDHAAVMKAIIEMREGRPIVVAEEGPDGLGDLVAAADRLTVETTLFMVNHGGGLLYVSMPKSRCDRLLLDRQNPRADFTKWSSGMLETVDATEGITTGISATDRMLTIRALGHPLADPDDVVRPGHITPYATCDGGTLAREGLGEASVDLASLSDASPAAAAAELLAEDGTRIVGHGAREFATEHNLAFVTVEDVTAARRSIAGKSVTDSEGFRDFFGAVPSAVSIVATTYDNRVHASTVSAFCALSLTPKLLLVALDSSSELLGRLRQTGQFSLNILSDGQMDMANACSKSGSERLPASAWTIRLPVPQLSGSAASATCDVHHIADGGDHKIVVGRITWCARHKRRPLIHHNQKFHGLASLDAQLESKPAATTSKGLA